MIQSPVLQNREEALRWLHEDCLGNYDHVILCDVNYPVVFVASVEGVSVVEYAKFQSARYVMDGE